ncbi:MAG: Transcriptional regulator, AcrR family, partial [uncultured Solirubrobacteraceae bacterium]
GDGEHHPRGLGAGHPPPPARRRDPALRRRRPGDELRRRRGRCGRHQGRAVPPLRLQGRPRAGGLPRGRQPARPAGARGLRAGHGARAAARAHRRQRAPVHLARAVLPAPHRPPHRRGGRPSPAPGDRRARPPPAARAHDLPRPGGPGRRLHPPRRGRRGGRRDRQRRARGLRPRPPARAGRAPGPSRRPVPPAAGRSPVV